LAVQPKANCCTDCADPAAAKENLERHAEVSKILSGTEKNVLRINEVQIYFLNL
jgi:hypothetical protein